MFLHEIVKNPNLLKSNGQLYLPNKPPRVRGASAKAAKNRPRGCKYLLWYLGQRFGKQSSIHGVDRVFSDERERKERILWIISLVTAFFILIYLILLLSTRFNRKQFQTVIDTTRYPSYMVPFPEITICNQNRLNWFRLEPAKRKFLNHSHLSEEYEKLFTDIVALYDTLSFGHFERFGEFDVRSLEHLNYINFTQVVEFMSWRCDEIFSECMWHLQPHNCCEIFFPRKSQMGQCLAFNSIDSPEGRHKKLLDPMWPWRMGKYGPGSALTVRVLLREEQHSPYSSNDNGLMFMVTEPYSWYFPPVNVAEKTRTSVSLHTIVNFHDELTRSVGAEQRECLFEREHIGSIYKTLHGRHYTYENCQAECQQLRLLEHCNCTLDLFFPRGPYPLCQLRDMPCLAKRNHLFLFHTHEEFIKLNNTNTKCNCLHSCFYLNYITDLRSMRLEKKGQLADNSSVIEMDFYFRRNFLLAYRTTLVVTWVDLMVSFGGIAGLLLGCSLISIVELFYFLVVEMPKSIVKTHRYRQILRESTRKVKESVKYLLDPARSKVK